MTSALIIWRNYSSMISSSSLLPIHVLISGSRKHTLEVTNIQCLTRTTLHISAWSNLLFLGMQHHHAFTSWWRHNVNDWVSNHQPRDCLLNRLFRRWSKKTSKLRVSGLCAGNSPGTGEFPAQMASHAENVSIWWRHHEIRSFPRASYGIFCNVKSPVDKSPSNLYVSINAGRGG